MELKSCPDCNREWGVCDEVTNWFEMRKARFCETCGRPLNGYQPPNPPLTLNELREMVEEPVWIESPDMPNLHGWAINYGLDPDVMYIQYAEVELDMYGKTWLAYRRRPEKVLCKCIANVEGRCVAEECEGAVVAFDVKIFTPEQAKEFYHLINSISREEAQNGPRDFVPWEAGSNGKMGGVEPRGSE